MFVKGDDVQNRRSEAYGKDAILHGVTDILQNMTSDWDLEFSGAIGPATRLIADLAFESIDVVEFVVAIQSHFMRPSLPFEELLMEEGRYVDDLCVAEVVDFLVRCLSNDNGSSELSTEP